LGELRSLAGEDAETISVAMRSNQVVFGVGNAVLTSRLIDGQFPNFQQLLPDSFEHELRIDAEEFRDVVRRVGLLAQKNAPLRLSFTEGQVTVSAQTPDIGEASEPMPVPFSGEPFDIGFNPDFLRDGLEAVGEDDLILKLLSPLRPGLITGPEGSGFQYLIMPIRLNV
jgi:DNA polymerase-3 subunit beta